MRRVGALLLDIFIITILAVIVSVIAILLFHNLPPYFGNLMVQVVIVVYTFIFDYFFNGITIGKKAANLKIDFAPQTSKLKFAILHTLCKTVAISLSIISFILFLCGNGVMPYDKWLGIKVV